MLNRKISYLIAKEIYTNETEAGKELRRIFEAGIRTIMQIKVGHLEGSDEIINGAMVGEFLFGLGEYNENLLEKGENAKLIAWLIRVVADYVVEYIAQDKIFEPAIGTPKDETWYATALDKFYKLPLEESQIIMINAHKEELLRSGFKSVALDYIDEKLKYKVEGFDITRYMA